MSWLFGVISPSITQKDIFRCRTVHDAHLFQHIKEHSFYFACGGNAHTCFSENTPGNSSFWIGLGIVLQNDSQHANILSPLGWKKLIHNGDEISRQNGHFVIVTYANNTFEIRTDSLGLRTIYWSQKDDEIIISTRIDWISRYCNGLEVDYQSTGARWLLVNQLSYQSLAKNTHRLGPQGTLTIHNGSITSRYQPYTPTIIDAGFSKEEMMDYLRLYLTPKHHNLKNITLGLSGGLDSRVLLSLLLGSHQKNFQTHTFGHMLNPDVSVPARISQTEHFLHVIYDMLVSSPSQLATMLQSYASETNLVEPVSTALRLQNIASLDPTKFIMIDGGYGEIARRQYLNRLALYGKQPFRNHNIDLLYKHLSIHRGNFFHHDILQQMEVGARDDISYMLNTMPPIGEISLDNYLDLWAVRSRFPNFGSDEQARLDKQILNYMPFAQQDFVTMVFSMPSALRRNGKFFRELITANYPALTKYSLVKSGMTYPFQLSTKASWLYTKIKSKLGLQYRDTHVDLFLGMMKEYILDLLYSKNVQEHPAYNYQYIRTVIEQYYHGNTTLKTEVVWWLTFELWKKGIEQK